jgi:hypothetical protein
MTPFQRVTSQGRNGAAAMIEQIPRMIVGKVVHLRTTGASGLLSDCRFETIGGRLFIVGTSPRGAVPGLEGQILAVAWGDVEQFYVYNTVEEWRVASEQWKALKRNSLA